VFELILSNTVNSDGHKAATELSHNQIAAATGLSRRTVTRSIERLKKVNVIETAMHEDWYLGRPNRIAITSPLLVPLEDRPIVTIDRKSRKRDNRLQVVAKKR